MNNIQHREKSIGGLEEFAAPTAADPTSVVAISRLLGLQVLTGEKPQHLLFFMLSNKLEG